MHVKKIAGVLTFLLIFSFAMSALYAEDENQINLNSATVEELAKIPGLNNELAKKIVTAREENGEIVDMEELLDIEGIDVKLLDQLKEYLMIKEMDDCNC